MTITLNAISDRIEQTLRENRAPANVTGGRVRDGYISFLIAPEPGTTVAKIMALKADIALAMAVPSVSIGQIDGTLCISANLPRSGRIITLSNTLANIAASDAVLGEYVATLGIDENNTPLCVSLPSPEVAHILIAGTTGSGKTSLAHTIITSLTHRHKPSRLGVVVLDPKRRTESKFTANVSHHLLMPVAHTPDEQAEALRRVVVAMEAREIPRDVHPRIIVFADELADTALAGGGEALRHLSRIAARGREAGVHIIACTQNPSAKSLPEDLRRNFPLRLVGRVSSATDARLASGRSNTGAESLPGKGSFIAIAGDGIIRFQAAIADLNISRPCPIPTEFAPSAPPPIAAIPYVAPAQIAAPVAAPAIAEAAPINDKTVIAAMIALSESRQQITKTSVLAHMGRQPAGYSWRTINAIWDNCHAIFSHLPIST